MSNDAKFIGGLIVKPPNDKAPEYVKANLSIKRAELIAWLETEQGEWINADIKVSQGGKWYASVDDWKPDQGQRNPPARQAPQRSGNRSQGASMANQAASDFADDKLDW